MKLKYAAGILSVMMLLYGCATIPPGPSVMVLPGNGRSFDSFQADDSVCRQWAQTRTEWNANRTVNEDVAGGTIAGGALGAAAGALIGAASGNVGPGAAIGAGAGLLEVRPWVRPKVMAQAGKSSAVTTMLTCSACMPRGTRFRGSCRHIVR
jgi:hypothetical protein